jgi:ubiquinone/menaquinone biosynthesis C-methylase UbiE
MLGRHLDLRLLRLISHDRNIKTEEQIDAEAQELASNVSYVATDEDFLKFTQRAGEHFEWRGKKILDVACGKGDLANQLAMKGASAVYGLDIQTPSVNLARASAAKQGISNVEFFASDFHNWATTEKFDYVVSYEALDHIPDAKATLRKMASLIKDDGKIINFAAGFWRAPVGADHCHDFMRFSIPWTQLVFNEEALFTVRREKFRPNDPATSFHEIRGGLSMYTFSQYKEAIRDAGLEIVAWDVNYQLKYKLGGALRPVSAVLSRIPVVGEYFIFSVMSVLSKSSQPAPTNG